MVTVMRKPTLMAVFAHPDDEAFGTGGTLARYAAEGCEVHLVTATRGEAGQIAEADLATDANLPLIRERELRCACEIYGIHPPHFLDYVDGQLTIVHQGQAVGKLVRLIRQFRPQVVISFGPDGIYGHYDHIAVSRWVDIAFDLAASPDCFPDQISGSCQPHQVSKLYFRTIPEEQLARMSEDGSPPTVMMDGVPFRFEGRPWEEITTIIDIGDYLEQKLRAIRCHVTQVGRDRPWPSDEEMQDPAARQETFVLARSTVEWPDQVETDLFEGIR
jgi:LmbE family N-acetylglucosaminyl deacetylase